MRKKVLPVLLIVIIFASVFYVVYKKEKRSDELTLFGNVEIRQVDLSFQVSGKITKMFKEEGDAVKKGELAAIIDDRDYKANYEKSIAETARTQALSRNAQMIYDRQIPLCPDNTISKQDCDTITNQKNEAKAAYDSASAAMSYAKNQYDYSRIYAPADGIITTRVQEPGATVNPGQPVYTLSKNKPIWIRTYVSETDLGNIKYGMKARVLTDSVSPKTGKKREYTGWVGYISPVAEFTPKTVQTEELRTDLVYRIRVYVYELDEFLRQGMPTTVKINLHETQVREDVPNNDD
ncbi:MAG: efflux RND transporter periplasmic adaptor subunit [Heliobacteriaceae bacterium]|jgi:HlyD family secretion protein|nr:efflux RND transporter periplasmic adaptor subunit [Heliobacteriaceae bacterium]